MPAFGALVLAAAAPAASERAVAAVELVPAVFASVAPERSPASTSSDLSTRPSTSSTARAPSTRCAKASSAPSGTSPGRAELAALIVWSMAACAARAVAEAASGALEPASRLAAAPARPSARRAVESRPSSDS